MTGLGANSFVPLSVRSLAFVSARHLGVSHSTTVKGPGSLTLVTVRTTGGTLHCPAPTGIGEASRVRSGARVRPAAGKVPGPPAAGPGGWVDGVVADLRVVRPADDRSVHPPCLLCAVQIRWEATAPSETAGLRSALPPASICVPSRLFRPSWSAARCERRPRRRQTPPVGGVPDADLYDINARLLESRVPTRAHRPPGGERVALKGMLRPAPTAPRTYWTGTGQRLRRCDSRECRPVAGRPRLGQGKVRPGVLPRPVSTGGACHDGASALGARPAGRFLSSERRFPLNLPWASSC